MTGNSLPGFDSKLEKFTADLYQPRKILQPENGYRYAIDPFILAAQIYFKNARNAVDIGCGCGILPILLADQYPELKIVGVEIQEELAHYARKNVRENNHENRITIITEDIHTYSQKCSFKKNDLVVANPPYKKRGTGRLNPDSGKAIARHEIMLDLPGVIKSAHHLLSTSGHLYIIYPADRLPDIICTAHRFRMGLCFLRFIHTRPDQEAIRVVACLGKTAGTQCRILQPFFIYDLSNKHTDAYFSLFNPNYSWNFSF